MFMPQTKNFREMDYKQLLTYLETLVEIKNKLKCTICLDVALNLVELSCKHIFCETCFQMHKTYGDQNVKCPLCMNPLNRRSFVYKDKYADALSAFVRDGYRKVNEVYDVQADVLYKCLKDCKQYSGKVCKKDIKKLCKNAVVPLPKNVPSTSNANVTKTKSTDDASSEQAFDKLLGVPNAIVINKKGPRKTYYNKKRKPDPDKYEILHFDDIDNKTKIIDWLNDNKNKFDRLSQTQISKHVPHTPSDFDYPSVSQDADGKQTKNNTEIEKINLLRAKSLDRDVVKQNRNRSERHSFAGNTELEEVILDVSEEENIVKEAEIKVIQNILEDDCLDNFDEIIQSSLVDNTIQKSKTMKYSPESGWNRVKEMKKSVKKGATKKPKQLNITLESNGSKNKSDSPTKDPVDKKQENSKVDENFQVEKSADVSVHPVYDLDAIESYIEKNMKFLDKSKSSETSFNNDTEIFQKITENPCNIKSNQEEVVNNYVETIVEVVPQCKFCNCFKNQCHNMVNSFSEPLDKLKNSNEIIEKLDSHVDTFISHLQHEKDELSKLLVDCFSNIQLYVKKIKDGSSNKIKSHCVDSGVQTTNLGCSSKKVQTENFVKTVDVQTTNQNMVSANVQTDQVDYVDKTTSCSDLIAEVELYRHSNDIGNNEKAKQSQHKTNSFKKHPSDQNLFPTGPIDNIESQILANLLEINKTLVNNHNMSKKNQTSQSEQEMKSSEKKNNVAENDTNTVFTGSLDNFNFETQEVAKSLHKDQIKNDIQKSMPKIPEKTQKSSNKSNINEKNSDENVVFTSSLNNFDFETQEVLKLTEKKLPNVPTNENISSPKTVNPDENIERNQSDSVVVVSLDSSPPKDIKKINRKLTFSQVDSKKFKRIRMPNSDSDSDEDNSVKRPCHRFIRDDLSVQFADTEKMDATLNQSAKDVRSSNEIDKMDCDAYLDEVLKKFKTPPKCQSPVKKNVVPLRTDEKDPDIIQLLGKCDQLIEQATKRQKTYSQPENNDESESLTEKKVCKKLPSTKSSTNVSQTDHMLSDNFFLDEQNIQQLEDKVLEYEQSKLKTLCSEYSDIIGETESMNPVSKKRKLSSDNQKEVIESENSESIFPKEKTNIDHKDELNITQENLDNIVQSINENCVDDDVDDEIIEIQSSAEKAASQEKEKDNGTSVIVLDNIKLRSQNNNLPINENELRPQTRSKSNEEIFSDDDIVETTPQKDKSQHINRSVLSQLEALENNSFNKVLMDISQILPTSQNIEMLPPPPGFEDEEDTTKSPSKDQITVINKHATFLNNSSITPDNISQLLDTSNKENNIKKLSFKQPEAVKVDSTQDLNMSKKYFAHSTPYTQNLRMPESLQMSPISKENSTQLPNLIEKVKSLSHTPLVVTSPIAPKHTIMTSTPKQKSIWNYIKTPQEKPQQEPNINVSAQSVNSQNRKPCVACTRLNRNQVSGLSCLTNKKLITFSSSFTSSVTHMIVAVKDDGSVKDHTAKFVLAVAAGIWVLKYQWVEDCIASNSVLPEEPYEVLDVSGLPGPKLSRLTRKSSPLFKGFVFHCSPPFINITEEDVKQIITSLGGELCSKPEKLVTEKGSVKLIVTETCKTQDFDKFEAWLAMYKVVTVDVEWIIKSVGQYKVQSIRPFLLCSDDSISELNFPAQLLELVPMSYSEPLC